MRLAAHEHEGMAPVESKLHSGSQANIELSCKGPVAGPATAGRDRRQVAAYTPRHGSLDSCSASLGGLFAAAQNTVSTATPRLSIRNGNRDGVALQGGVASRAATMTPRDGHAAPSIAGSGQPTWTRWTIA